MRAVLAALLLCPALAVAQPVSARDVLDAQMVAPKFAPRGDGRNYDIKCPRRYRPVLTADGRVACASVFSDPLKEVKP